MCLAIMSPIGWSEVPLGVLRRGFKGNPDGAGFMWSDGRKLHIKKGYMSFKTFLKALVRVPNHLPCAIHFRWGTGGVKDATNCHPFRLGDDGGIIHNGVLPRDVADSCALRSDTHNFVLGYLDAEYKKVGLDAVATLEGNIGYNKLVAMDRHGCYVIVGESQGSWKDGVWYSNDGGHKSTYFHKGGWEDYRKKKGWSWPDVQHGR